MKRGLLAAPGVALCCLPIPAAASAQDSKPTEVRVEALVNDIQQLDLQSHSYNVDRWPTLALLRALRGRLRLPCI